MGVRLGNKYTHVTYRYVRGVCNVIQVVLLFLLMDNQHVSEPCFMSYARPLLFHVVYEAKLGTHMH